MNKSEKDDAKQLMLEHSKAKVNLFKRYLSIYLNILNRVDFINHIRLYDLFAGEGIYSYGGKGSAVSVAETIRDHYYSENKKITDITFTINEPGISEIEPGVKKLERIKKEIATISLPGNLNLAYHDEKYEIIISEVIQDVSNLESNERALLFIDPWGYKEVDFNDLKVITANKKAEVILFLPIYFMYRFTEKSLSPTDFPGGRSLENILKQIFDNEKPNTENQELFIKSIKKAFQKKEYSQYVDTFVIERAAGQLFSLFFFTDNQTGMRAMLESKWKEDEERGHGFRINANQGSLFKGISASNFPYLLEEFLRLHKKVSNEELYEFILQRSHLPKHANEVLKSLKKRNIIEVNSLDGLPAKGNYLGDKKRLVEFIYKQKGE